MKKSFSQKVKIGQKVILYEMVPPPVNTSKRDLESSMKLFCKVLGKYPVDAINLPEVREENRGGVRSESVLVKIEPRVVAQLIGKFGKQEVVINRPVVHLPKRKQIKWFIQTIKEYGQNNFILVGGESSKVKYPGPSVSEVATILSDNSDFNNICLGGITIPSRKNEAQRLFEKSLAGIDYFTSQVLYESSEIKKVLREYWELCCKAGVKPKTIILSFAPVSTNKDLELLKWLGVEIPEKAYKTLTLTWLGVGWRSLDISSQILEDVLEYVNKFRIEVPLGLNIEHISRHNFELSLMLLNKLSKKYLN